MRYDRFEGMLEVVTILLAATVQYFRNYSIYNILRSIMFDISCMEYIIYDILCMIRYNLNDSHPKTDHFVTDAALLL